VEEFQKVVPKESAERRVEEAPVGAVHGDKVRQVLRVGEVAAALAADEDLLPRAFGFFEKEHFGAQFRCTAGGDHPPGAGSENNQRGLILWKP